MLSITNLLCDHRAGNEKLRYGHTRGASRAEADAIPRPVVVWAVTKACNLRCVHCYASADAKETFVKDFVAAWTKVMNADRFDLA